MRSLAIWAAAVLTGWTIVRCFLAAARNRTQAAKARALGCLPPPATSRPWWDPLGAAKVREALQATKEGRMLERIMGLYEDISHRAGYEVRTFGSVALGRSLISTRDPENIKAILATQFHDFEISGPRIRLMGALLGEGIVSQWN